MSIHAAASECNVEVVKALLDADADPNAVCAHGWTPLHHAANKGHIDAVKALLDGGANVNAMDFFRGWTPLHHASKEGRVDVVKVLCTHGADTEIFARGGWTPLHLAAYSRNIYTLKAILEAGANVNVFDTHGRSPLHHAVYLNHVDAVKALIDTGANVNAVNVDGKTPLHHAAVGGYVDCVKVLLDADAGVNYVDTRGRSPLLLASFFQNCVDILKMLLDAGADVNAASSNGKTPLCNATDRGHTSTAQVLLVAGADPSACVDYLIRADNTVLFDAWESLLRAKSLARARDLLRHACSDKFLSAVLMHHRNVPFDLRPAGDVVLLESVKSLLDADPAFTRAGALVRLSGSQDALFTVLCLLRDRVPSGILERVAVIATVFAFSGHIDNTAFNSTCV